MPRSPFFRPLSAFIPSPLEIDVSFLEYQGYPFPDTQEQPKIDSVWTKTSDDGMMEDGALRTASPCFANPLLHCIVTDHSDYTDSESATVASLSPASTSPSSPSPSDISFVYARGSSKVKRDSDIIGSPRIFTDVPLSLIEIKEDRLAVAAAPIAVAVVVANAQVVKVKFMKSTKSPAPSSRALDIVYFSQKALPDLPTDRRCSSSSSSGIAARLDKVTAEAPVSDLSDTSTIEAGSTVDPTTEEETSVDTTSHHDTLSRNDSTASSNSGSSRSLSSQVNGSTVALLLNTPVTPVHPLYAAVHGSVLSVFIPPLVLPKTVSVEPRRLHYKLSKDSLAAANWGKSLFKRRREKKGSLTSPAVIETGV